MSKAALSKALLALSWSDMDDFMADFMGMVVAGDNSVNDLRDVSHDLIDWAKYQTKAASEPPKPDDGEWIPHDGGPCPVDGDTLVNAKLRNGSLLPTERAFEWHWVRSIPPNDGGDIIAYCVVKP